MNAEERRIYASFPSLIDRVDPANLEMGNRGGLPYNEVKEGHYYVVKVKGYPEVEPNRPHGEPHVENKHLGYRYFMIYITSIVPEQREAFQEEGVAYIIESFKNWPDTLGSKYSLAVIYSNVEFNQPYRKLRVGWNSNPVWTSQDEALWWDITSFTKGMDFLNWFGKYPLEVKE